MSDFQLDTSGYVLMPEGGDYANVCLRYEMLDAFTQGYVEALLRERAGAVLKAAIPADLIDKVYAAERWAKREGEGRTARVKTLYALDRTNRPATYTATRRALAFSDLAPETLATIIRDCAGLSDIMIGCVMGGDIARGRVAWHWRQHEKAAPRSPAQELHDQFPPITPTLGDDGLIYFREAA